MSGGAKRKKPSPSSREGQSHGPTTPRSPGGGSTEDPGARSSRALERAVERQTRAFENLMKAEERSLKRLERDQKQAFERAERVRQKAEADLEKAALRELHKKDLREAETSVRMAQIGTMTLAAAAGAAGIGSLFGPAGAAVGAGLGVLGSLAAKLGTDLSQIR